MATTAIENVAEEYKFNREMIKLVKQHSPEMALHDAVEAYRGVPDAFNALREAINVAHAATKGFVATYEEFSRMFGTSLGIGCGAVVHTAGAYPNDVEEDSAFVRALTEVGKESNLIAKLSACVKLNRKLVESIKSWESKLMKLQTRNRYDGATEAEMDIIARRLCAVNETIARLKARGNAVSELYFKIKRKVDAELLKIHKAFVPMFVNPAAPKTED